MVSITLPYGVLKKQWNMYKEMQNMLIFGGVFNEFKYLVFPGFLNLGQFLYYRQHNDAVWPWKYFVFLQSRHQFFF